MKKNLRYLLTVLASLMLLLFFIHLGFKDDNVTRSSNDQTTKMQYALVNEDRGANFEGKHYVLGSDFVTLINKDTTNRWETTTRNIATAGVANGQFDAQIIIPQDFSEKLLSLQAVNPEQASVEYQVRDGKNELTNQAIQDKVNAILKDFNQRVIQMYFSSIVENLVAAQQNVNRITDTELAHQNQLEENIYQPFKEIPTNYTTVLSTASILDEDHKVFTAEQEAFVKSVQTLLESNNKSLESSSETTESVKKSVNDYSKEANEKIKKSIEQFSEQFERQKEELASQWENDTTEYKNQFDQLNGTIGNQFSAFYTSKEQGGTGVYANFLSESKLFQETQSDRIKELQKEIAELHKQVEQLTALKKQIATTYYNDSETTPETATDAQIKQAIIQLITNEKENRPNLNKNYQKELEESLSEIPAENLRNLVDKLEVTHVISVDQGNLYREELEIVNRYAREHEIDLTKSTQFMYLEPKQLHGESVAIPQEKVTFSLDTNKETVISLQGTNDQNGELTFTVDDSTIQTIKNKLNQQLANAGYSIDVSAITPTQLTITKPVKIKTALPEAENNEAETQEKSVGSTLELPPPPEKLSLTIDLPITWQLTPEQQKTAFNQINYSWLVNNEVQNAQSFSVYIAMDQPLVKDVPEIMKQFQLLDTVSQQIVTIFGNPNQNLSIQEYATMLIASENQDKTIEELAGEKSIYWMYDNLTENDKTKMITDKLLNEYKKTGNQLYRETQEQINQLNQLIGTETDQNKEGQPTTLYGTLNLMTVPEKLLQEADKLNAWFDQATKQVDATYDTWHEAKKVAATSVIDEKNPHPAENQTTALDSETESLVKMMQTLMETAKETSATTAESAANVKDVAPTIKELKASTAKVQDNAKNILTDLNDSIDESKKTTKENEEYAKTFEKVLANTRDGGADNPKVFNFLSNPIQGEGVFGKTRQASLIPYYATLIGALLTLVIALTLQSFMKKRAVSAADALVEPTRVWQNGPNLLLSLTAVILLASVFSLLLMHNVAMINRFAWFSYSFLVFTSGALLLLACLRQFKKLTLYIYSAILGLFFMLTPLLGIATKPGSLSNWLYRLSPLQNIQNGFTALINGVNLSWISYLVLIVMLILGVILNLVVRPEEQK
ncbi:TPA: type VII secretion protein EsaA [Enterococcus faecalis]|nr:type VII secretion protein EsaA [Enterococcus faecalis]EKQ3613482.1 type VII secretion protein EsaA [Enterococcus faecalis]